MKQNKITVNGLDIKVSNDGQREYISLTDMVKNLEEGTKLIENWIRSKNTLEYLAAWETIHNAASFNSPEFEGIRKDAGSNRFLMSVNQWVERTKAIGIRSKAGRYGGTEADPDIAFHFAMWISPMFQLLVVKEFQQLKQKEALGHSQQWDMRRFICKANYKIQTDAIKLHLVPISNLPKDKEGIVYAQEAELLNFALFGMTSKDWKAQYPQEALHGMNIRDFADTHQLIVLSNLESINAEMIKQGIGGKERLKYLQQMAADQMKSLSSSSAADHIKLDSPHKQLPEKKNDPSFNENLKAIMKVPNPNKDDNKGRPMPPRKME